MVLNEDDIKNEDVLESPLKLSTDFVEGNDVSMEDNNSYFENNFSGRVHYRPMKENEILLVVM